MEIIKRRSRTKPKAKTGNFKVTAANAQRLLEPLSRYKKLPSLFLKEFYGNGQGRKRLTTLFHEPEDLPSNQKILIRYDRGLNNQQLHELGQGGHAALRQHGILDAQSASWARAMKIGSGPRESHDIMAALAVASIELAARKAGVRFISHMEILRSTASEEARNSDYPLRIPFQLAHQFPDHTPKKPHEVKAKTYLEPDAIFGLKSEKYTFFALEFDTGSEPEEPTKDLTRPSWLRKILSYTAVSDRRAGQAIYESYLGIPNLLVLVLAPDTGRLRNIQAVIEKYGHPNQYLCRELAPLAPFQNTPPPMDDLFTGAYTRAGKLFHINKL
jgi:hypothetical protein